jgi:hypothetical protein
MEGEASVHLLEAIYIHAIQNEVNKICEDNCYGCEVVHPSQRNHDCLMMDDEERWLLYTTDAVMQVKCKYCIWSEFIEATRVLKMIHRENMRTRLQQLESIDDPMLLKSLREQHLTEENRKIHCIINYLSYWRNDAGKIGQASST